MKRIRKTIIMITVVCICIAGALSPASAAGPSPNGYTLVKETDIGVVKSIKIDVASFEVRVIKANDYGFEIYHKNTSNISHSIKNGVLSIEQYRTLKPSLYLPGIEYVNVYLPDTAVLDLVDIRNASGFINVDYINCTDLSVTQASGSVDIKNFKANEVRVRSASGRVIVKDGKANSYDLTLVSGNLSAERIESQAFKADLVSGRADLNGSFTGYTAIKCTSGSVKMSVNGAENDYSRYISMLVGKVTINNKKAGTGKVQSTSGNTLDIRMLTGSIDITFQK